jgi:hypothetical protein
MALEDKIDALIKSLDANTAALGKIAGAAKTAAAAGGTTTKPAGKAAVKLEDVQKAYSAYLTVTDEDEREKRKAKVVKINEHFGVAKVTAVDPAKYGEALEVLKKVEAGEMFADDDATEEGESLV